MARLGRRQPNRPTVKRGKIVVVVPRTPPTIVAFVQTSTWQTTTSPKNLPTLTWQTGDIVIVTAASADSTSTIATPTVSGLTFNPLGSAGAVANSCWIHRWSAIAASGGSGAISVIRTGTHEFGAAAWQFRGSDGVGVFPLDVGTAKVVSVVETLDESAVIELLADWGAGPTSTAVWTPAGSTPRVDSDGGASTYSVLGANWADVDTASTTNYGLTAGLSVGPNISKIAVEVLGVNTPAGQTVAINQIIETDVSQPMGKLKAEAINQVTETDIASAITEIKTAVVNRVIESDTAQTISRTKRLAIGQISETDVSRPIGKIKATLVNRVTESDISQPTNEVKTKAIVQAVETDVSRQIIAINVLVNAIETDVCQPITSRKIKSITQISETDVARPIVEATSALNQCIETDVCQPINRLKTQVIGRVTETSIAQPINEVKTKAIVRCMETDVAQPCGKAKLEQIVSVTETDVCRPMNRLKTKAIQQLSETNIAQPINEVKTKLIVRGTETDIAQPVNELKAKLISQISETDVSRPITTKKLKSIVQAIETDNSGIITRLGFLVRAIETDIANSMTKKKIRTIGVVSETDTSRPITHTFSRTIARSIETDLSNSLINTKIKLILPATESNLAQQIGRGKNIQIAVENDSVGKLSKIQKLTIISEIDLATTMLQPDNFLVVQAIETDFAQTLLSSQKFKSNVTVKLITQTLTVDVGSSNIRSHTNNVISVDL